MAFVADVFGLRSSAVSIRSGGSSRHKRLRLDGIDLTAATTILEHRLRRPPRRLTHRARPSHSHPVCVALRLGRPNETVTQTPMVLGGGRGRCSTVGG